MLRQGFSRSSCLLTAAGVAEINLNSPRWGTGPLQQTGESLQNRWEMSVRGPTVVA